MLIYIYIYNYYFNIFLNKKNFKNNRYNSKKQCYPTLKIRGQNDLEKEGKKEN
jgi:hypothetical protein